MTGMIWQIDPHRYEWRWSVVVMVVARDRIRQQGSINVEHRSRGDRRQEQQQGWGKAAHNRNTGKAAEIHRKRK